jgi:acyl dehydratase
MLPALHDLQAALAGRSLPGGTLRIDRHESMIADHALRAPDRDDDLAHPLWFVIASLRGMGITVDELGDLAVKRPGDTLLLGGVTVTHDRPLHVGATYRTRAQVEHVDRQQTRSGRTLDRVVVTVRVQDDQGLHHGAVTSTYLFLREAG